MVTGARDLDFVELHLRSALSFLTGASGPEAVVRRGLSRWRIWCGGSGRR